MDKVLNKFPGFIIDDPLGAPCLKNQVNMMEEMFMEKAMTMNPADFRRNVKLNICGRELTLRALVDYRDFYNSTVNRSYPPKKADGVCIKDVIFNDPATIVFWTDGTKTVVKAENEPFDKEKGLAMAICKRTCGNKGNYFNVFRKYCHDEEPIAENEGVETTVFDKAIDRVKDAVSNMFHVPQSLLENANKDDMENKTEKD